MTAAARAKRFDIQMLRGIAVLVVVIFHALHDSFPKGFLGVDVFFVISGFLITGMILRDLQNRRFTFTGFYLRRARRLLPASLATLAGTTLLALLILTPFEMGAYAKQLFGALTFTANFVLAQQTGYFEGSAETKPLLHIWSLSLEEQFYFVAPLLLWLTPLRARPALLIAATLLSMALCYVLVSGMPVPKLTSKAAAKFAFFLLPPRAWELLLGGVAAWAMLRWPGLRIPAGVKYGALAVILLACLIGVSPVHPGPDALIVTLATALILLGRDDWLHANPLSRMVATVGDWSYSLYLVHWPLFSFAFILYLGRPPLAVLLALGIASVALGWLQYRYVEQRFQRSATSAPRRSWALLAATMAVLGIASIAIGTAAPREDPNTAPIEGLARNCEQAGARWEDKKGCSTGDDPQVLLWGDSYAMHLVPGLSAAFGRDIAMVQATKSACAPALGLAHMGGNYSAAWARQCIRFNAVVTDRLKHMPSVRYVILSSAYTQLFLQADQQLSVDGATRAWAPIARQHLAQTVRAIQAAGKVPILIGSTPIADFDVGLCNARMSSGRLTLAHADCRVDRQAVDRTVGGVNAALREIGRETGAPVLLPVDVLCDARQCQTRLDDISLYRDRGHLSQLGSRLLIERLGVAELVRKGSAGPIQRIPD